MTLIQRIEQAGGISARTCAHEASPANNYTVISDLKATVYALALELQAVAEAIRDGEPIEADKLATYAALPGAYDFRAGIKSRAAGEGSR